MVMLSSSTAHAQKGGGGGGLTSSTFSVYQLPGSYLDYYQPKPLKGTTTLTRDRAQTMRSISAKISNAPALADGTVLNVVYYDIVVTGSYYGQPVYSYTPYNIGQMVVTAGAASMSVSTDNGDQVPVFGSLASIEIMMTDDMGDVLGEIADAYITVTGGANP
jgi:hypothetical protein